MQHLDWRAAAQACVAEEASKAQQLRVDKTEKFEPKQALQEIYDKSVVTDAAEEAAPKDTLESESRNKESTKEATEDQHFNVLDVFKPFNSAKIW